MAEGKVIENNGRPTDYRPEFDNLIIEYAKKKWSMWEIAAEFNVCVTTMWRWTLRIDSFCKAYARAKTIQVGGIFREIRENSENRNYNHNLPKLRLQHEGDLFDQRKVRIRGIGKGTLTDMTRAVFKEMGEGELTADEAYKAVSTIATAAKVEEVTELRDKVKQFEELDK